MKTLKYTLVILAINILVFPSIMKAEVREDIALGEDMTVAQFAGIMVDLLDLERPSGSETLPEAELFEVETNMLAERGISTFLELKPEELVTCSIFVNVLYDALLGPNEDTTEEKVAYLSDRGYMDRCVPGEILLARTIITVLNIPALTKAIAEAYGAPGGAGFKGISLAPSNPAPESIVPTGPVFSAPPPPPAGPGPTPTATPPTTPTPPPAPPASPI